MKFKSLLPTFIVSLVLCVAVFIAFQSAKTRQGTVVLPGGITYLGPTPTPPTSPNSPTSSYTGKLYPYSFSYPSSFSLGWFPNDPYDAVTAFLPNTDSNKNIFFRVEKLSGTAIDYANNWWKNYTWKGVSSVTAFTNSKGLKGYRAKYLDTTDKTPYDHVFFEVPGRTDLIMWISGKLFTKDVFDKLVDSVSWTQ